MRAELKTQNTRGDYLAQLVAHTPDAEYDVERNFIKADEQNRKEAIWSLVSLRDGVYEFKNNSVAGRRYYIIKGGAIAEELKNKAEAVTRIAEFSNAAQTQQPTMTQEEASSLLYQKACEEKSLKSYSGYAEDELDWDEKELRSRKWKLQEEIEILEKTYNLNAEEIYTETESRRNRQAEEISKTRDAQKDEFFAEAHRIEVLEVLPRETLEIEAWEPHARFEKNYIEKARLGNKIVYHYYFEASSDWFGHKYFWEDAS